MKTPETDNSPLRLYLRYYAAEMDAAQDSDGDASHAKVQDAALKLLPGDKLEALIKFAEHAMSSRGEDAIRAMFRDGHLFFVWNSPDAAKMYLSNILTIAKRIRMT